MGNLCFQSNLSDEERRALEDSVRIERALIQGKNLEAKKIKLLLLGTGESGKSTIFKQMQILYDVSGFSPVEISTFAHVLRRNVVESLQTLIRGCKTFGYTYKNPKSQEFSHFIQHLNYYNGLFWDDGIVAAVIHLWHNEPAIRKTYDRRSELQLLDSAAYLYSHIERIGSSDYKPNKEDILRARLRTSGIVEKSFKIHDVNFVFIDVGGQRNERRKWLHCFDEVTAVIFVVAVSEYDQYLFEDEKRNRMQESLEVFDSICNHDYFKQTPTILFLNKMDLLQEKLLKTPLKNFFPDYRGDNSFEDASEYIKEKFIMVNQQNKPLFAHLTCACDTENVERVFDACRVVILKKNMDNLGYE